MEFYFVAFTTYSFVDGFIDFVQTMPAMFACISKPARETERYCNTLQVTELVKCVEAMHRPMPLVARTMLQSSGDKAGKQTFDIKGIKGDTKFFF